MSEQDELLLEFLVETKENLDHLDQELLALETSPTDSGLINSIFRRLHTIKGVCGFLDFHKLESVSHAGETLLDEIRNDRVAVSDSIVSLLLRLCDAIRKITETIEQTKGEGDTEYGPLAQELLAAAKPDEYKNVSASKGKAVELTLDDEFEAFLDSQATHACQDNVDPQIESAAPPAPAVEAVSTENLTTPQVDASESAATKPAVSSETSLRVDVELLDQLMNLAGELVLARNQILQSTKSLQDASFRAVAQRLNLVTSELQEGVMKTRMQPIHSVWNKFPRVVRDLAKSCKKQVRLEMHGKDTELDKTLIEAIKDPLTHIIRNSIDHGIEAPDKRLAAGKSAEGCITMGAFQEGGYVIIEIVDDGAGLNTDKIRERAIERGIISRDRALAAAEPEIHRLIFAPGFSTADVVTNLSGRGVGMDVVKSSVERIGGHVDISSWRGEGSVIRLKIPLTLAIIPALLLSSGGQRFAIPQPAIIELVQLNASERSGSLSWIGSYPFFKLREELLPLVFLSKHLEVVDSVDLESDQSRVVIVLDVDGCRFGLVVDEVYDTEEIVVKPLGRLIGKLPIYAGATILGDGQIALIIDPVVLAREARVDQSEAAADELAKAEVDLDKTGAINGEIGQLLLVQLTPELRAAIPLNSVRRLEEFSLERIERVGQSSVIQYRGSILQLIDVARAINPNYPTSDGGSVVVVGHGDCAVGLRVQSILDVSERISAVRPAKGESGVLSYGVIQDRVVALLDIEFLSQLGGLAPSTKSVASMEASL
jgi:two-component system chemotaxis sensor kinase CheA